MPRSPPYSRPLSAVKETVFMVHLGTNDTITHLCLPVRSACAEA